MNTEVSQLVPREGVVQVGQTSDPVFVLNRNFYSVAIYPSGGATGGRVELSISSSDRITDGNGLWHPWIPGDVAVPTMVSKEGPVTAIRVVSVDSTVMYEVLQHGTGNP